MMGGRRLSNVNRAILERRLNRMIKDHRTYFDEWRTERFKSVPPEINDNSDHTDDIGRSETSFDGSLD